MKALLKQFLSYFGRHVSKYAEKTPCDLTRKDSLSNRSTQCFFYQIEIGLTLGIIDYTGAFTNDN